MFGITLGFATLTADPNLQFDQTGEKWQDLFNNSSVLPWAGIMKLLRDQHRGARGAKEALLRYSDLSHSQDMLTARGHFGNTHLFWHLEKTKLFEYKRSLQVSNFRPH